MNVQEIKSHIVVEFGRMIRQRRQEMGITEEELAWRAHISDRELRNIEYGRVNPKADTVIAICIHLNIGLEEFRNIYPAEAFDYV